MLRSAIGPPESEILVSKLKCDQHQRRVVAVNGKVIHRGGWGDVCTSPTVTIGNVTFPAMDVEKKLEEKSWSTNG